MINYYRISLPQAAEMQAPLIALLNGCTRKNVLIKPTEETTSAFENCKKALAEATTLTLPQPNTLIIVVYKFFQHGIRRSVA
jgi:hypothetical protein